MTAGWAALNTLREAVWDIAGSGDIRFSHYIDKAKGEHEAALALVQTALEAAERFAGRIDAPEYLREALRAVREGK